MPSFSKRSLNNLATCHPDLIRVAQEAIKHFDFVVICGERGEKEQNAAYARGASNARYGQSAHNYSPSLAFDAVPYPIDWQNIKAFTEMCKVFEKAAKTVNVSIRLGRDFRMRDYPHVELLNWRTIRNGV